MIDVESRILRITGFQGRIEEVFVLGVRVIRRLGFFIPFFSPMRYASARGLAMKAPFNNNLPRPSNDVMDNPENPVNPVYLPFDARDAARPGPLGLDETPRAIPEPRPVVAPVQHRLDRVVIGVRPIGLGIA